MKTLNRYDIVRYRDTINGIIIGFNKHGYILEYKVKLLKYWGNYAKYSIVYFNANSDLKKIK